MLNPDKLKTQAEEIESAIDASLLEAQDLTLIEEMKIISELVSRLFIRYAQLKKAEWREINERAS